MSDSPETFLKPPSLATNKANGGQNPTNKPVTTSPLRRLFTIGTRGGN